MTEYLTEQEQVEMLKNWVKQYALVIILGIVIATIGISGWRWWQERQAKILSHASAIYNEMLTMRSQNNSEATTRAQAEKLYSHYPKTPYGHIAGLMLARTAETSKDYSLAEKHLNWVIDHAKVSSFRQIARLRLARIQIAEKQPQQALDTLATVDDKWFAGLIDEVRGDAWLAKNDMNKAREAWQKALAELPNADVVRPLLRMKYDNLAATL